MVFHESQRSRVRTNTLLRVQQSVSQLLGRVALGRALLALLSLVLVSEIALSFCWLSTRCENFAPKLINFMILTKFTVPVLFQRICELSNQPSMERNLYAHSFILSQCSLRPQAGNADHGACAILLGVCIFSFSYYLTRGPLQMIVQVLRLNYSQRLDRFLHARVLDPQLHHRRADACQCL